MIIASFEHSVSTQWLHDDLSGPRLTDVSARNTIVVAALAEGTDHRHARLAAADADRLGSVADHALQ